MSKSLIKNVDGIGIWVREDYIQSPNLWFAAAMGVVIFLLVLSVPFVSHTNVNTPQFGGYIFASAFVAFISATMCFLLTAKTTDTYVVYSGSDGEGIIIPKTTDTAKDQLAICKAAKQIESRCHEIAAKRAELDRIAAGCK